MKTIERLLSRKQLAELLGVQVNTIQRWHWKGADAPPFIKIGRSVRYRESEVVAWLWKRAGADSAAVTIC